MQRQRRYVSSFATYKAADLPNFGPHAFRHMLARHVAKTCTSVAELVATSQNLGHSDVLTTLRSYGQISRERQRALVTGESDDEVLDDSSDGRLK